MITSASEYFALYHQVTSGNPPDLAVLLPSEENIYEVDLNTRTITAPEHLGVHKDQRAEVIYFKMDRFYDHFDLSTAIGVIEYINANGESYIYGIPFYDITTLNTNETVLAHEAYSETAFQEVKESKEKILFPWIVSSDVTRYPGTVQFAMSFYVLNKDADQIALEGENPNVDFLLRLNLLPATSTVLKGIGIDPELEELETTVEVPTFLQLYNMYNTLSGQYALYWDESATEMEENPSSPVAPYAARVISNIPTN